VKERFIRPCAQLGGALLLVAAIGLHPSASGAIAPTFPGDLRVLTHNLQMLPTPIGRIDLGRAALIGQASYWKGYDVAVLEELFDSLASPVVLRNMSSEYPYQTPIIGASSTGWDQTLGTPHPTVTNGGVAIVSRYPIVEKAQDIYPAGCGADALAAKGFAYARVSRNGHIVHVIGTHLQADDPTCILTFRFPALIRASQLQAIATFIAGKNIPSSEPVVITGDLNISEGSAEYTSMLSTLRAAAPTTFSGAPFSMDGTTNSMAGGGDRSTIDYVLFERNHLRPTSWTNEVLTPKSPPWDWAGTTYHDYSDHYPVAGHAA
jgi:sphingomyelin phosphodiesterase